MTIKELIQHGVRKATQEDWPINEWLELPSPDPNGFISTKVRYVVDGNGMYFEINDLGDEDYIEYEESPVPQLDLDNLRELPILDIEAFLEHMKSITFEQAKSYILKFGPPQYRGCTLDQIARYDDGLKYLDFIVGMPWLNNDTKEYIQAYLGNDGIKRDLENMI